MALWDSCTVRDKKKNGHEINCVKESWRRYELFSVNTDWCKRSQRKQYNSNVVVKCVI